MKHYIAFSLSLLVAACGGADFTEGEPPDGDPSAAAPDAPVDSPPPEASGGSAGATTATGGSPSTGGVVGSTGGAQQGTGGVLATGGAVGATGGVQGTGGAPDAGLCGPAFECPAPATCRALMGVCCLGAVDAPTGCGCAYATGVPGHPGCRAE
jgi:hypothetical protein